MKTYREILKQELAVRSDKNVAYSLRAYARDMGVSPAYLSRVLKGEKGLSEDRALDIGARLGWADSVTRMFALLVRIEKSRHQESKKILEKELQELKTESTGIESISNDIFCYVSDWFHSAIIELAELPDFNSNADWVSKKLGITEGQAQHAVERLVRLGILKSSSKGMKKTVKNISTGDVPSAAIRKFHVQMLDKAKQSVRHHPQSKRDVSGMTMAINPAQIPIAKKRIRAFRREMMDILQTGPRSEIYQLSVQLFRLDK